MEQKSKLEGLKQFQIETVKSVIDRFYNKEKPQTRVLVADEVGLGKTMIARGALAEVYEREKNNKEIFKVVYICSNQNIAIQNIEKIIGKTLTAEETSTCDRLSIQSFKLFENEEKRRTQENGQQIYPVILTPDTSFKLKRSRGKRDERALICATLCKISKLEKYHESLKEILAAPASAERFQEELKYYLYRIEQYEDRYIRKVENQILEKLEKSENNKNSVIENLEKYQKQEESEKNKKSREIVKQLRFIFSELGIEELKPDLVIMDEFQRFQELISAEDNNLKNEEKELIKKFFSQEDLKVLLLSATPYKPYATQEEIDKATKTEEQRDIYYNEFLKLMKFLYKYDQDEENYKQFKTIWNEYSEKLRNIDTEEFEEILKQKEIAEETMYKVISRTERMTKTNSNNATKLKVEKQDIRSYVQIRKMIENIKGAEKEEIKKLLTVDYIKSCPYILSYMNTYKLKQKIENYHIQNRKIASKQELLWIDTEKIDKFKYNERNPITKTNAKLDETKEIIFKDNIEKLLWIPPTMPYYNLQYPFNKSENITKTLIFSKWAMIPKMISSILSYESERKTIYEAYRGTKHEEKTAYFLNSSERYPSLSNLEFKKDNRTQKEGSMTLFTLLYPSEKLSSLYNPIDMINKYKDEKGINTKIKQEIFKSLKDLVKNIKTEAGTRKDNRWYYLFPLLVDDKKHVERWIKTRLVKLPHNWINKLPENMTEEEIEKWVEKYTPKVDTSKESEQRINHIKRLTIEYIKYQKGLLKLGPKPSDLYIVLTNMVLASPANCVYRNFQNEESLYLVTPIAYQFIKLFKERESLAILDLCYKKGAYWQKVLQYCYAGNLQAVVDEYFYMIAESNFLNGAPDKNEQIEKIVRNALSVGTRNISIDTYENFKNRIMGKSQDRKRNKMRTRFAVGYSKETDEEKEIKRKESDKDEKGYLKESIRNAFNSPFRPFVLTTTSVGQEGLDFHYYCKRIVHWNLPDNPIDIEQREGRINRYKCLAIRKFIAKNHNVEKFKENIWNEMFESIKCKDKKGGLVPYWCIPDNENLEIEKIVPVYPFSIEETKYEDYKDILALYKITLGQENQERLIHILSKNMEDNYDIDKLLINLSPYYKNVTS